MAFRTLKDFAAFVAVDFGEVAIRKIFDSPISMLTRVHGITRSN
jgi:hypothetical protein